MPWQQRPSADREFISKYSWVHPAWKKWHRDVATGRKKLDIKIHIKLASGEVYDCFCKRTRNTINPPYNIKPEA